MTKKILLIVLSVFSLNLIAQENDEKTIESYNKNAIGLSAGLGFGIDYARTLKHNKLYASVSYNVFVMSLNGIEQEVSGEELIIDSNIDFQNVDLRINYHPFSNAFKLVGGLGYFTSSNVNVKTTFKNDITIGDVTFNTNDSGNLNIDANWTEIAPYLGIGFGRLVSNKKFGFSFDFGSYFSSSPEITLDATGIIEQTEDQEALLNESFTSFKFIPYASFRVSYAF